MICKSSWLPFIPWKGPWKPCGLPSTCCLSPSRWKAPLVSFVVGSLSLLQRTEGGPLQRIRTDVGYGKSRVECKKVGILDHRSDVRILYFIFKPYFTRNTGNLCPTIPFMIEGWRRATNAVMFFWGKVDLLRCTTLLCQTHWGQRARQLISFSPQENHYTSAGVHAERPTKLLKWGCPSVTAQLI